MIEVLKPGLETSIQDLPGRIGYWEQGFPPSAFSGRAGLCGTKASPVSGSARLVRI